MADGEEAAADGTVVQETEVSIGGLVAWNPVVPEVTMKALGSIGLGGVEGEDGGCGVGAGVGPRTQGFGEVRPKLLLHVAELRVRGIGAEQGGRGCRSGFGTGGLSEGLEGHDARSIGGAVAKKFPDPGLQGEGSAKEEDRCEPGYRTFASGFPKSPGEPGTAEEAKGEGGDQCNLGGVFSQAQHVGSWLVLG